MHYICSFMYDYSSTTLFCEILVSIFCIHVFFRKIAILIFKSCTVHRIKFTKNLTLNLFNKIRESIAINEASFLSIVPMKVKVKRQSIVCCKMFCKLFYSKNSRLLFKIRIYIESIQVFTENVHSEMSSINSVYIYHRDNHKHKHFS
jgi:hypothetical protein